MKSVRAPAHFHTCARRSPPPVRPRGSGAHAALLHFLFKHLPHFNLQAIQPALRVD